jgi:hypothetical protein
LQSYKESDKNICPGFSEMEKETLFDLEKKLGAYVEYVKVRGVE